MAARLQFLIFFCTHSLENNSSNWFEIFIGYWYLSEDVHYRISPRSEIQYGRWAAILDFLSWALSPEQLKQLMGNFCRILVPIRECALLNFRPFLNRVWPPGHNLDFFSCALSQEQLIWNFNRILLLIRGCVLLIFRPVWNPIWLPGNNLEFLFTCIISRTIDLKFW